MIKITDVIKEMLVQLAPEVYWPCVVFENGKTLYFEVLQAIYGLLQAALLWYKNSGKTWSFKASNIITMTHLYRIEW